MGGSACLALQSLHCAELNSAASSANPSVALQSSLRAVRRPSPLGSAPLPSVATAEGDSDSSPAEAVRSRGAETNFEIKPQLSFSCCNLDPLAPEALLLPLDISSLALSTRTPPRCSSTTIILPFIPNYATLFLQFPTDTASTPSLVTRMRIPRNPERTPNQFRRVVNRRARNQSERRMIHE